MKHDGPGLLSMAIGDRDERGSLFSVTFKANNHLDRFVIYLFKSSSYVERLFEAYL